jgi:hypothetical protein
MRNPHNPHLIIRPGMKYVDEKGALWRNPVSFVYSEKTILLSNGVDERLVNRVFHMCGVPVSYTDVSGPTPCCLVAEIDPACEDPFAEVAAYMHCAPVVDSGGPLANLPYTDHRNADLLERNLVLSNRVKDLESRLHASQDTVTELHERVASLENHSNGLVNVQVKDRAEIAELTTANASLNRTFIGQEQRINVLRSILDTHRKRLTLMRDVLLSDTTLQSNTAAWAVATLITHELEGA